MYWHRCPEGANETLIPVRYHTHHIIDFITVKFLHHVYISIFFCYSWDYGELREASPVLAGWYFFAFVIVGIFFLLNMFVAILSDSITEVRYIVTS